MTRRPTLDQPPTLDEYRSWATTATRPLTDPPIGTHTLGRRTTDAANSTHVTTVPKNDRSTR